MESDPQRDEAAAEALPQALRTALARTVAAGLATVLGLAGVAPAVESPEPRPRLRDLGVEPGIFAPGPENAITDVAGVRVGHRTLVRGDDIRTGVTAVLPHGGNLFQEKVPAAVFVGNGFGKAAGFLQVQELGTLETPVVLTNTLAVGTAVEAVARWTLGRPGNQEVRSVNALVGETNDSYLNDIRAATVTAADVLAAIDAARTGPVAEGSVGAGTGTRALGFKGGIGTASRRLPAALGGWTVGALVQSNFGGVLAVDGVPVGKRWGRYPFQEALTTAPGDAAAGGSEQGSCMIVVATDAPLSPRNLERLAQRALLGLGRTGGFMANGSGDFVVAFSTARRDAHDPPHRTRTVLEVENDSASPLFLAAVEATEEAILNSLLKATSVTGHRGHRAEAIPVDALVDELRRHGRLRLDTPRASP
jgi:D-aminopeptidase